MDRTDPNRAFTMESDSPARPNRSALAGAPAAVGKRLRYCAAAVVLLMCMLLAACNYTGLQGFPQSPPTPVASPTAPPASGAGGAAITATPGTAGGGSGQGSSLPTDTPAIPATAGNSAPTSVPTVVPTETVASSAPDALVETIKSVIQKANQEEVQAFESNDPSVMADTATNSYYQQMVQSFSEMSGGGVTAVKLVNLDWGPITQQDANTVEANTTETWLTTFSDGSTMQETDPNVYTLVMQGGTWKVQDDQHPNTRTLQPQPGTPGAAPTQGTSGTGAPSPVASVIPPGTSVEQSSNWAGYSATGGTFTSVSADWTVPNVSAGSGNTVAADATWVGIGGANSNDLIQAGTQATVQGGQVIYTAWWETLPQAAQTVPLDVAAGDSVNVQITQQQDGTWQIVIKDSTSGQSFQKSLTYDSSLSSAEWIEESPTVGRRTLVPLDDFGTLNFTNATTVENGNTATIAEAGGQPITMYSTPTQGRRGRFGQPGGQGGQAGQALAQPSALGADGASFSVTRTNAPAPVVVP